MQRDIPYVAIIQAFQGLIRQLLTESEVQIHLRKERLLEGLQPNGQVLIDAIPDIELIIGKQPPVIPLAPQAAQNRLNLVFQNFVKVMSQKEHPLVLFIDDLQWADLASLQLLHMLMTDADNHYFLVIGAYRDNEVDEAHPLMSALADMDKQGVIRHTIEVQNLSHTHVNTLIADSLLCDADYAGPLTDLVYEETRGNAFFTAEFLKSLYDEDLLAFEAAPFADGGGRWTWDVEQIYAKNITENVVELMAGKIGKLAPGIQEALRLAACIGNQFDLRTLSIIQGKRAPESLDQLWEAMQEGLILPLDENYKFVHMAAHNQDLT